MALSDQQIQFLQQHVKNRSMKNSKTDDPIIPDFETGQQYQIINRTPGDPNSKDVTQAIAVAPIDSNGKLAKLNLQNILEHHISLCYTIR
jgi:hypothetical protein